MFACLPYPKVRLFNSTNEEIVDINIICNNPEQTADKKKLRQSDVFIAVFNKDEHSITLKRNQKIQIASINLKFKDASGIEYNFPIIEEEPFHPGRPLRVILKKIEGEFSLEVTDDET